MSLNGLVHCDCLSTGLLRPPPWPIYFHGPWLAAAPGYKDHNDEVLEWGQTACAHPQFELVDGQIFRGRLFQILDGIGGAPLYPTLYEWILPGTGREVPPADSARCLAELDELAEHMRHQRMVRLIDVDLGRVVHIRIDDGPVDTGDIKDPAWRAIVESEAFRRANGLPPLPDVPLSTVWLDEDAMVRVRDIDGEVLFAAREFEQEETESGWWFRDIASGDQLRHSSPMPWNIVRPRPKRLRAEDRPMDINQYIYGVRFLRELFTASVQVGHPVHLY